MSWRVVVRPDAQGDVAGAAQWYESRQDGLGGEFREAVVQVLDALADNPLLNCRQHPRKNIRWRYPRRFPYRVIYEVIESEKLVVVAAVLAHSKRRRMSLKQEIACLVLRIGSRPRLAWPEYELRSVSISICSP